MSPCRLPVSPIARRAALTRLLSVVSETMRPCQTFVKSSSLLTTRSRCSTQIDEHIEDLGAQDGISATRPAELAHAPESIV